MTKTSRTTEYQRTRDAENTNLTTDEVNTAMLLGTLPHEGYFQLSHCAHNSILPSVNLLQNESVKILILPRI